jgi:hypothetical protein
MRYFTLETVRALFGEPPEAGEWAAAEWERRINRYRDEIDSIRASLPERLASFLEGDSLYEYHVERISLLGNEIDPVTQVRFALEVEIETSQQGVLRRLIYKGVKRILVDIDTNHTLLRSAAPGTTLLTDTWLYDEISVLGPDVYRHEILLASGGRVRVDFQDFSFVVQQNLATAELEVLA